MDTEDFNDRAEQEVADILATFESELFDEELEVLS